MGDAHISVFTAIISGAGSEYWILRIKSVQEVMECPTGSIMQLVGVRRQAEVREAAFVAF